MGLAISNALEVCQFLKHATRMTLELEKSFSGVERLVEYAESLPREPSDGAPLPALNWPTAGGIVAKGLCVRYRPELPHALRDVSCSIAPRSKVGIAPNPSPTPDPNPNPNPDPNPKPQPRWASWGAPARASPLSSRHCGGWCSSRAHCRSTALRSARSNPNMNPTPTPN